MSVTPISVQSRLAPNPSSTPKLSVEVQSKKYGAVKVCDPKATRALVLLMNQHAVIGGAACHWGGPSAFAEISSAVHGLMFQESPWFEKYNFVNDAGHAENGIYALRANYGHDNLDFAALKKFRSIESKLTGHGESHLNPEGVLISNGPLGSGVPQAQGLAMADKLTGNERKTICLLSDGGAMEGETKEALAAIPGLWEKKKINPFLLIISDNDTKLSGRITEDSFCMGKSFKSLKELGWNLLFVEDGHNQQTVFNEIETALDQLNEQGPTAIVFKTVKGKGIQSTEESSSGGHGYPLKAYDAKLTAFLEELYQGETVPEEFSTWANEILSSKPEESEKSSGGAVKEKVQVGVSNALIDAAKKGLPVVSITSDLPGSTGVAGFRKEFPERSFDIGIAESNMVSTAIGFSLNGYIPVVDTFSQFGVTKGNLPLIMSGLSAGPLIGIFSHTGFQDAADGASHQATTYISAIASIPNVEVISLASSQDAHTFITKAIDDFAEARKNGKTPKSTIFFLGRETHPRSYIETQSEWQTPQVLSSGKDALLVTTGPLVDHALSASELLKSKGIEVGVVNHSFLNNPNTEEFSKLLKDSNNTLITVEDHQTKGGMGSLLTQALNQAGHYPKSLNIGIEGKFGQSAYKAAELYGLHGFNADGIAEKVTKFL
ncbi:MAG: transketolase C-terminal domain-containing protein [Bacteriovoracaceae bacterium]